MKFETSRKRFFICHFVCSFVLRVFQ